MTMTVIGVSVEGRNANIDKDGKTEYRAVYKVKSDNALDGALQAMEAFGIPQIGDTFSVGNDFDNRALVIDKSADQGDSPLHWLVNVTWSSDLDKEPTDEENPLNQPYEITYGFQNRRVIVPGRFNDPAIPPTDRAYELGIFAPNGELFDPQPEVDLAEPVVTIVRNVASIDPQALMALANSVNSDFFQGAEPRQLKMNAPQAQRKFDSNIGFYWTVTYGMAFRWETWDIQVLNQGYFYFSGGWNGTWSTTQQRLTKKIDEGAPVLINLTSNGNINTSSTPTFTRLRVFREVPFGALGLI